eukprot:490930-Prorocentrum_minimum.AAC.1
MEYHTGAWGLPCLKGPPQPSPPPKPISLHVMLVMHDELRRNNLQELLHRVNYQVHTQSCDENLNAYDAPQQKRTCLYAGLTMRTAFWPCEN